MKIFLFCNLKNKIKEHKTIFLISKNYFSSYYNEEDTSEQAMAEAYARELRYQKAYELSLAKQRLANQGKKQPQIPLVKNNKFISNKTADPVS
jgi:hypothetical protein